MRKMRLFAIAVAVFLGLLCEGGAQGLSAETLDIPEPLRSYLQTITVDELGGVRAETRLERIGESVYRLRLMFDLPTEATEVHTLHRAERLQQGQVVVHLPAETRGRREGVVLDVVPLVIPSDCGKAIWRRGRASVRTAVSWSPIPTRRQRRCLPY